MPKAWATHFVGASAKHTICCATATLERLFTPAGERCDKPALNVFRSRLEYPALKRAVREQRDLFNASVVLIEDKASGTQLLQELIAEGCHGVTRYQPTGDKTMRMHAQTAMIENGFVHIPETAPWVAEFLHEMTVF
ncbi:MAG TPA: phage terminase large subunit, partial [Stellaceae bacterium]|nr:phage terminase large subunit [Stellaceae bacterium]